MATSGTYLGIDIGTSGVKTVLIDEAQAVLASAEAHLQVSRPQPGWSEQDPESWWQATLATLDSLRRSHPVELSAVKGIGLSGQMHGATLLDSHDQPLRPAILWNDGRSARECAELEQACPQSRAIAGNIAMAGFTAPKLLWVAKHEPDVFARTAKVLLPKDYVRLKLSGAYACDMSDAAGTLWLDVAARDWSDTLLEATGLNRSHMPDLVEGSAVSGTLLPDLVERCGMASAPVVAGGGGDNAASACGMGTVRPGDAFVSLGTSGVLFVSNAEFSPNTEGAVHAFCHALPNTWHQMGVILSAAGSLEWLSSVLDKPVASLMRDLGEHATGPSPVRFLPYLSGERTPHNDATARGAFIGLAADSSTSDMTRAVLDGVAFAFADCQRTLAAAGTDFARATAVGGGARSALWLEILATVLDRPIELPEGAEQGAAFGAARLGMIAATGTDPLAVCARPNMRATIEPRRELQSAYTEAYAQYRALYPALKEASSS
ncbi:MAG: xylulokinase [Geminicoccaceae bacterium]